MASSYEIAQQIAEQNQWFVQQNALASQIGVNPMAFGGGMGGFSNAPFMGAPVMQAAPGAARGIPGAFNYGAGIGAGYATGNRIGALGMGGVSSVPALGGMALSLASMTSWGAPLQPFLNPVSGFMAGRGLGLGFGGSAAFAGAAMLPAMAVGHMFSSTVGGAAQQSMVNTALSGMNFFNPASRTGMGFGREEASAIGSRMRELAYVPELLTSMDELTRMIPRLRASGLMQGVTNASEFSTRFREAITTLRDVSKLLGTTMDEASEFFAHSRSVGMLGRGAVSRNAVNALVTMGATGMDISQFQALQQSGANLATALGGSRAGGARGAASLATQIGLAVQNGALSQETLQDMTGQVGPAAQQAAAARLLNATARLSGTPGGQVIAAAAMRLGANGEALLDPAVMEMVRTGAIGLPQLQSMASRNMANRDMATAFVAHQGTLTSQAMEQGGAMAVARAYAGPLGSRDPNRVSLVLQQQAGLTEQEANTIATLVNQEMLGNTFQGQLVESIRRGRASTAETTSLQAIFRKAMTRVGGKITRPFEELGASIHTSLSRGVEEFVDDLVGNVAVSVSEESKRKFMVAFAGGGSEFARFLGTAVPQRTYGRGVGSYLRASGIGVDLNRWGNPGTSGRTAEQIFAEEAAAYGRPGGLDINSAADRDWLAKQQAAAEAGQLGPGLTFQNLTMAEGEGALDVADYIRRQRTSGAWKGMDPEAIKADVAGYIKRESRSMMGPRALRWALVGLGSRKYTAAQSTQALIASANMMLPDSMRVKLGITAALSPHGVKGARTAARDELEKAFGDKGVAEDISKNPRLRKALKAILGSAANTDELQMFIRQGDTAAAREAASRMGIDIAEEDVDALARALSSMKDGASAQAALGLQEDADNVGALFDAKNSLLNQATMARTASAMVAKAGQQDLADAISAAASAYSDLAGTTGVGGEAAQKAGAALEAAHSRVTELVKKNPKLFGALPPSLQSYYRTRTGVAGMLQGYGAATTSALASRLGLPEEEVARAVGVIPGGSEKIALTSNQRTALAEYAGRRAEGRILSEVGSTQVSPKDQAVIAAMTAIAQAVIALAPKDQQEAMKKSLAGIPGTQGQVDWSKFFGASK